MTVTIQKWGNSQGIRIPKYILDELTWSENETVDLTVEGGKIIKVNMSLRISTGAIPQGGKYGKAGRYYQGQV